VPVDAGEGDVVVDTGEDRRSDSTGDATNDERIDGAEVDALADANDAAAEPDIDPTDGDGGDETDVDQEVVADVDATADPDTLVDADSGDIVADRSDADLVDATPDVVLDIDPDEGRELPDIPDINVEHGELALRGRVVTGGGRIQGATYELRSVVGCVGPCENTLFGDTYEVTGTLRER